MSVQRFATFVGLTSCLIMTAAPARAEQRFVTTGVRTTDIIESCRRVDDTQRMDCGGYIAGVFDTMSFSRSICPPTPRGITAQAIAIALKYLNDHPEQWHHSPAYVIGEGFRAAFPCRPPS